MVRLKLGIIGVVNRSQFDIEHKTSIRVSSLLCFSRIAIHGLLKLARSQDSVKAESEFFRINYPTIANKCGTAFLAKSLNRLLLSHIRYLSAKCVCKQLTSV